MKYGDTNLFIYAALGNPNAKLILTQLAKGQISLCTSTITWDEFVWAIRKYFNDYTIAITLGKNLLQIPNLNFLDSTNTIINRAQQLVETYRIRPKDAIHIATALANGINEIVSDDSDFDKVKEIKRVPI